MLPTKPPGQAQVISAPPRARELRLKRVPLDEAGDENQSLELMVLLPLDLPKAWRTGELRIILEGSGAGGPFTPYDVIPKQAAAPYAVSEADEALLAEVERIHAGRVPGVWMLSRDDADAFFELDVLALPEARQLANNFLAARSKRMSQAELNLLLSRATAGSPLYLSVALEELTLIGRFRIVRGIGGIERGIHAADVVVGARFRHLRADLVLRLRALVLQKRRTGIHQAKTRRLKRREIVPRAHPHQSLAALVHLLEVGELEDAILDLDLDGGFLSHLRAPPCAQACPRATP